MNAPTHNKIDRLAGAALHAGVDGKWKSASRYVQRINDECGPGALARALMGWCDTMADHATDGQPVTGRVNVDSMQYESGALGGDVPGRVRWATRVVKARAEMNELAFQVLLEELNHLEPVERGSHVAAVLEGAALAIRGLPRGYARMGRTS